MKNQACMIDLTIPRYPAQALLLAIRILCMLMLFMAPVIQAEEANAPAADPAASSLLDTIKTKLEALESDEHANDETSERLKDLYREAIANRESASSYDQLTADHAQTNSEAPAQTDLLREKMTEVRAVSTEDATLEFNELSLAELEPLLLKEKADLAAVEATLTKNHEALKYHTDRPQAIRQRLIETDTEVKGIASKLQQPLTANESATVYEAEHWVRETQAVALTSEIRMLNEELLSHTQLIELIRARIELAETNIDYVEGRVDHLENLVNGKRMEKANQVMFETGRSRLDTEGQHPLLQQLAESNTELSRQISQYTFDLKQVEEEAEQTNKQAKQIDQDYKTAQRKLEIAGMSKILGRVLQEQRRALPDTRLYRKKVKQLETKIADVSLQQLEYKEEHRKLSDLENHLENYMLQAHVDNMPWLTDSARELLRDRNEYLSQLISIQDAYARALSELDFSQTRLLDTANSYDDFLAKNLLWIRSSLPVNLDNIKAIPGQLHTLLSPANWQTVVLVPRQHQLDSLI